MKSNDIHIPPEAVEAALQFDALCASFCKPSANDCQCRQNTYRAIRAALAAWPGVNTDAVRCGTIILHLPKDNPDA